MKNLLTDTLQALNQAEIEEIRICLSSAQFNHGNHATSIRALFSLLVETIKEENLEALDKKEVFYALFPGKTYKPGSNYFENLMSELMALVRQFITQQQIKERWGEAFEDLALARFFRQRNQDERCFQALNRARAALGKAKGPLQEELPLLSMWVEKEENLTASKNNSRQHGIHLDESIEALSIFYGSELMKYAVVLEEQLRVAPNVKSDWIAYIEETRRLFRKKGHFSNPVISLLDQALELMSNIDRSDMEAFQAFLDAFRQNEALLPLDVQKMLASYARNFATKKGLNGVEHFKQVNLALYKEHIAKGWLYEYGKLQPGVFVNMVNIGLKMNDTDWVWGFLNDHQNKVLGENAMFCVNYGFANYFLKIRKKEACIETLVKLRQMPKPTDPILEKLFRILEIKITYEYRE